MSLIYLQCKNCQQIFSSGINLGIRATAVLKGNISQCPFCGSMENIPDGTFKGTVGGFIEETVSVLKDYVKLDSECINEFTKLKGKETCFGWEEPLLKLLNKETS